LATLLVPGDWLREHRARPLWLLLGWLLVLLVIYLSLTPAPVTLPMREGDKLSHAFAYFVLMSWFANLYAGASVRAAFAAGFTTLGVILEFVQLWTGYRSFEVTDMAASAFGVAVGWVTAPPRLPNYLSLVERLWRTR
jgi:VanZ family protein